MKNFFTKGRIALLVIFSVLIIDQVIKVIVKTHMYWHESIRITDCFRFGDIREIVPYFISNRCGRSDRLVPVQVHKAWNENRVYCLCLAHPDGCAGQYHRQRILWSAV